LHFINFYLISQINSYLPYVLFIALVIYLICLYWKNKEISNKVLNRSILIVAILLIAQFLLSGLLFYLSLKSDKMGLGRYLLPGKNAYYFTSILYLSYPMLYAFISSALLAALFYGIRRYRPAIIDSWEIKLIVLLTLVCGWPRLIFWLFLGLVIFLLSKFHPLLRGQGIATRTRIAPYLLVAALLVLIFAGLVGRVFILLHLNF